MTSRHVVFGSAWRASLAAGILATGAVANAADWVEHRTALDRPGAYHAGFDLRVTDEQGRPVEATVSVCPSGQNCNRADGRLTTATTDDSGHAVFRDLSSSRSFGIYVKPPERLRPRYLRFEELSNANADLGILRLKRNVVVTGTVTVVSGETRTMVDEGRVSLHAVDDGAWLPFAPVRDGWFRLEDFDVVPMEIEFDDWTVGTLNPRVPLPVDPERHRQHFELIVDRQAEDGGSMRVVEVRDVPPEPTPVPAAEPPAAEPSHRIELRLVDTEGEPITGAWISVADQPGSAFTDADGRVSLDAFDTPHRLFLSGPWGTVSIGAESRSDFSLSSGAPDVVADLAGQREIEIPVLRRVEVEVSGIDPQDLSFRFRHFARPWETVDPSLVERVLDDYRYQSLLRLEAPGRLPRFAAYPPRGGLVVDFTADRPFGLEVVDEDGPVAGATVDLIEVATPYLDRVAVNDPEADIVLASLPTDAEGRLARLGNPRALYLAYVYADGYEPARVVLQAGSETRVELAKREMRVAFAGLVVGELLRVRVAGRDSLVALRRVADTSPTVVSLSPGTYDASVANESGIVERGTTFVVDDGDRVVDTTVDRRPELVLRLPQLPVVPERYRTDEEAAAATPPIDRWRVQASRRMPPGGAVGGLAVTYFGGVPGRESPVEVEPLEDGETPARVLRFAGSGRWLVFLGAQRRSLDNQYFVEVTLAAGETRELGMPPLDASLVGAYERDLVANTHGVAGPRMMLIRSAGADSGWNVVNYLPGEPVFGVYRDGVLVPYAADGPEHHEFALRDLPAGDYHLFHHLGEDSVWGGVEVSLPAGRNTAIPRLGSDLAGTWMVDVVDSEGLAVRDQVLRIRDRMHEAWEAYSLMPTTGTYAADGIPFPPAARLRGEPVSFDSIRPGWVELVLDDPAGPARHYLRKVEPGRKLTLVVDD